MGNVPRKADGRRMLLPCDGWPGTTLVYMLSALFAGIFVVGRRFGVFESAVHLRELFFQDPTMLYLSGRVLLAVV